MSEMPVKDDSDIPTESSRIASATAAPLWCISTGKQVLRSYAEIDDVDASSTGPRAPGKKPRVDKRRGTVPCKKCGTKIKFRYPQRAPLNLDDTFHRCLSKARQAVHIESACKQTTEELKARYRALMRERNLSA